MSTNLERITAHNARLAAMKETVAGLPEAGGGASAENYTVDISCGATQSESDTSGTIVQCIYNTYKNGILEVVEVSNQTSGKITLTDVAKHSLITIVVDGICSQSKWNNSTKLCWGHLDSYNSYNSDSVSVHWYSINANNASIHIFSYYK